MQSRISLQSFTGIVATVHPVVTRSRVRRRLEEKSAFESSQTIASGVVFSSVLLFLRTGSVPYYIQGFELSSREGKNQKFRFCFAGSYSERWAPRFGNALLPGAIRTPIDGLTRTDARCSLSRSLGVVAWQGSKTSNVKRFSRS